MRVAGVAVIRGTGLLPAVVPGVFDAWALLLRDHGAISLADALGPPSGYAQKVHPVLPLVSAGIEATRELFLTE